MRAISAIVALLTLLACDGCTQPQPSLENQARRDHGIGDVVIINARVWTGAGPDARSVVIVGEHIAYVGHEETARSWIDARTRIIDAGGRRVVPGITDSHAHIVSGGFHLSRLNLREIVSRDAFVTEVARAVAEARERAEASAQGGWVTGGRWSVESWDDPTTPRKEWIDLVSPETPIFLSRMDGHQGLANSVSLRLAGIKRDEPEDPPGGVIERDPDTREPTGILKDSAMDLVARHLPKPSEEEQYEALRRAMSHANEFGITSMHDVSGREDLGAMFRAHRDKTLTIRIRKYLSVADWPAVIDQVKTLDVADGWLRVAGFKGYMDGSLGSRTAYMYRPYADAGPFGEYPCGILSEMAVAPKNLRYMIERADQAGLQCAVHAIGDEANHILLDSYASVMRKNGARDRRHRIEHAQHLLPEDIPRFAELGVVASMQPYHKADDGRYAETALGADRLEGSYAFRSLMDAGATVTFGSDWPVVTCNPFLGMWSAVMGKTLDGNVWIPGERITIEEALAGYTIGSAVASHRETEIGTIETGKLADLAILSQDILEIAPDRLGDTRAVVTIVGGKIVHDTR